MVIELFPAGNGDALLVSSANHAMLIDVGYTSTYRDHLKTRLLQMQQQGQKLNQLIVTHVDADHISGAIALVKNNGNTIDRNVINIDDVWFNSYRHLTLKDKQPGDDLTVPPPLQLRGGLESREADATDMPVSHRQGTTLGSHLLKNNYNWNSHFGHQAVQVDQPIREKIADQTYITLLSPTPEALQHLADQWYKFLRKKFAGKINENAFFDDAFELMMEEERQAAIDATPVLIPDQLVSGEGDWVEQFSKFFDSEDDSETNGSSITFVLEMAGKKALFLGDAIPSQIIAQIKKIKPANNPLQVDVLKVAHHGAWSNNDPELFALVHADYYLFSSNGVRHHHPHLPTLAWILKKNTSPKTLVFNYRQKDRLSFLEDAQMQKKYNYALLWPDIDDFGRGKDGYIRLEV